jgi:hypothetical protein
LVHYREWSAKDLNLSNIPRVIGFVRSEGEVVESVRVATGAEHEVRGDTKSIGSMFLRASKGHVVYGTVSELMKSCTPKIDSRLKEFHWEAMSSHRG